MDVISANDQSLSAKLSRKVSDVLEKTDLAVPNRSLGDDLLRARTLDILGLNKDQARERFALKLDCEKVYAIDRAAQNTPKETTDNKAGANIGASDVAYGFIRHNDRKPNDHENKMSEIPVVTKGGNLAITMTTEEMNDLKNILEKTPTFGHPSLTTRFVANNANAIVTETAKGEVTDKNLKIPSVRDTSFFTVKMDMEKLKSNIDKSREPNKMLIALEHALQGTRENKVVIQEHRIEMASRSHAAQARAAKNDRGR